MKKISRFFGAVSILISGLLVIGCSPDKEIPSELSSAPEALVSEEYEAPQLRTDSSPQEADQKMEWEFISEIPEEPIILESLSQIKVREGEPLPALGTTIYPLSKLPKECGKFWIFFGDGFVEHMYACNHEGHDHN